MRFDSEGFVGAVVIDGGPFADTAVGRCIVNQFRTVRVPAFSGGSIMLGRSFTID